MAICDERSEIAGMYNSEPSFDLGPRTDVLDGCDKVYGMIMLIRSMSPQVIIIQMKWASRKTSGQSGSARMPESVSLHPYTDPAEKI